MFHFLPVDSFVHIYQEVSLGLLEFFISVEPGYLTSIFISQFSQVHHKLGQIQIQYSCAWCFFFLDLDIKAW